MPTINWTGKQQTPPQPASLTLDSTVYPNGNHLNEPANLNKLFLGDNFQVMSTLLTEYEGKVDLIYTDPPFFTNRKFPARIGRGEDSRKPAEWQLAEGYGDAWNSLDDYIQFLYERLHLMHRLLSPTGSIYLHLDWHADGYARMLLDEIFGEQNLINEIIWTYHGPSPIRSAFNRKHDTILSYSKSSQYTFNADAVRIPYDASTKKTFAASPTKAGFGKVPDLERGKVPEDWWYFPVVARLHNERTGYPTQKPEALVERVVLAASNPGDLIADFFCGSGTTALVAAKNERNFLTADAGFRAIHTARKRLIEANAKPFSIYTSHQPEPNLILNQLPPLETLDYWECDPTYSNHSFNSQQQGFLPWRGEGTIPKPVESKLGSKKRFRAINLQGDLIRSAD